MDLGELSEKFMGMQLRYDAAAGACDDGDDSKSRGTSRGSDHAADSRDPDHNIAGVVSLIMDMLFVTQSVASYKNT